MNQFCLDPKWSFQVYYVKPEDVTEEYKEAYASISQNSHYFKASIKFYPTLYKDVRDEDFNKVAVGCIVHELLHVVVGPLAEQAEAFCGDRDDLHEMVVKNEEQVVSHLEALLMSTIKL